MDKTANEQLFDALLRHQIYLLRYSASVSNRMVSFLNATEEELARLIRDGLRNNTGLTSPSAWRRLERLQKTIAALRSGSWEEASALFESEALLLTTAEAEYTQRTVATVSPVVLQTVLPSPSMLKAITLSRPFEGRVLREWAATMEAEDIRRIHAAVQTGMLANEDSATIARRVIGTGRLKGSDGMTELTRRQVTAITRTAVNYISNSARAAFFDENAEIVTAEQFVATLDSRTTPICRANDGKVFPRDKGPRPPLHYACRSLRIAALDGVLLGERPAKPTTERLLVEEYAQKHKLGAIRSRDALPRGTKGDYDAWARKRIRQLTGQVPGAETYQTWLKKQSAAFQDDILGTTRAKLFRRGDLTLDRFVDHNGREFSLAELARRERQAFIAAGLDPAAF